MSGYPNSNTTNVKVKCTSQNGDSGVVINSNTTNVKVKCDEVVTCSVTPVIIQIQPMLRLNSRLKKP